MCHKSFINSEGKCQDPITTIDNCVEYSDENNCKICENGFYFDITGCKKIPIERCNEVDYKL